MINQFSKVTKFENFSDELIFEIFDRLSPINLYRAFYGLNHRINKILQDRRMCFRDNISSLNLNQFNFYMQSILPRINDRLLSFTIGSYDTDEYQQASEFLHSYSMNLSHFKNLRTLVIIKIRLEDIPIIQLAIIHFIHLVNLRLSVDSNDVNRFSVININNNFFINPKLKNIKMNMCARTTFKNVDQLSNIVQLSVAWCQLQELTHLLQYTPDLCTLKATIYELNDIENWKENICGSFSQKYFLRLTSLKLVIDSISFDHLLLFLHELNQLRSLWLILNHHEYVNAEKWESLFQSSLSKLDQLDLTIAVMKPFSSIQIINLSQPSILCQKFNTKFWFSRGWHAKLEEYDHCIRLIVSNNITPTIKRARRQ